jgi:hypothetical protein
VKAKRRVTVTGAMFVLVFAWTATALGGGGERPRKLVVAAGGERVKATLGSYCVFEGNQGVCADAIYPLPVHGRLAVRPRQRIEVRTHDREVESVEVEGLRVKRGEISQAGWDVAVAVAPGGQRSFRPRLPDDLGRANRLDISLRYEDGLGDANYWIGIRVNRGGRI